MRKRLSKGNWHYSKMKFGVAGIFAIFVAGCTTSLVLKPMGSQVSFNQYKSLAIQTSTSYGVVVSEYAQSQIKRLIQTEIVAGCCANRFESISLDPANPQDLVLSIRFTRYEEMFPTREIYAEVEIKDGMSGKTIATGHVGKSSSLGGVVGALVGMGDLEISFAKEVSEGLGKMLGISPSFN